MTEDFLQHIIEFIHFSNSIFFPFFHLFTILLLNTNNLKLRQFYNFTIKKDSLIKYTFLTSLMLHSNSYDFNVGTWVVGF
jgi:hypothetical protein